MTQEGAAFGYTLLLPGVYWTPTFGRSRGIMTRKLISPCRERMSSIPITHPLPHIADHVVKAVAIGSKSSDRRSSDKTIFSCIFIMELSLPSVRHEFSIRHCFIPKRKFL